MAITLARRGATLRILVGLAMAATFAVPGAGDAAPLIKTRCQIHAVWTGTAKDLGPPYPLFWGWTVRGGGTCTTGALKPQHLSFTGNASQAGCPSFPGPVTQDPSTPYFRYFVQRVLVDDATGATSTQGEYWLLDSVGVGLVSQPVTPAAIEIRGTNAIGGPCSASPVGGLKGLGAGAYTAPKGNATQVTIKGLFVLTLGAEEV